MTVGSGVTCTTVHKPAYTLDFAAPDCHMVIAKEVHMVTHARVNITESAVCADSYMAGCWACELSEHGHGDSWRPRRQRRGRLRRPLCGRTATPSYLWKRAKLALLLLFLARSARSWRPRRQHGQGVALAYPGGYIPPWW